MASGIGLAECAIECETTSGKRGRSRTLVAKRVRSARLAAHRQRALDHFAEPRLEIRVAEIGQILGHFFGLAKRKPCGAGNRRCVAGIDKLPERAPRTASRPPSSLEATTGIPLAIASRRTKPKPSHRLGRTKASASL